MLSGVCNFMVRYVRKDFKSAKTESQEQFFLLFGLRCQRWSEFMDAPQSMSTRALLDKYMAAHGPYLYSYRLRAELSFCA